MTEIIVERLTLDGKFPSHLDLQRDFSGAIITRDPDGSFHVYRKDEYTIGKTAIVAHEIF